MTSPHVEWPQARLALHRQPSPGPSRTLDTVTRNGFRDKVLPLPGCDEMIDSSSVSLFYRALHITKDILADTTSKTFLIHTYKMRLFGC